MPADSQQLSVDGGPEGSTMEGCEPANNLQMQVERNAGGQFLKGQSGNPAGRVSGSRNRATMIMEQLFDGASGDVSKEALAQAMNGDGATLRLIVRSVIGARRNRASSFAMPPDARTGKPPSFARRAVASTFGPVRVPSRAMSV